MRLALVSMTNAGPASFLPVRCRAEFYPPSFGGSSPSCVGKKPVSLKRCHSSSETPASSIVRHSPSPRNWPGPGLRNHLAIVVSLKGGPGARVAGLAPGRAGECAGPYSKERGFLPNRSLAGSIFCRRLASCAAWCPIRCSLPRPGAARHSWARPSDSPGSSPICRGIRPGSCCSASLSGA